MASAPRDDNYIPGLVAENDSTGVAEPVLKDNATGGLYVQIVGGSSSGTEYTEGDTDATFSGLVVMAEGPSNTATPLQVDSSKNLQVDIAADSVGIGGGTQYEDAEVVAIPTGTVMMGTDGSNVYAVTSDTDGHLQVDVLSGGGAGVQYTEGDTDASITGNALMLESAANTLVAAPGTAADGLLVNLGSNNDITGTVTANLSATDNAVLDAIDAVLDQVELNQDSQTAILTTIDAESGGR